MESKEAIMAAAMALIQEKGDRPDEITVREVCKRSGVGLGLVNYHFGNKEHLIEVCVERIVNGIVQQFREIQQQTEGLSPRERLERLGAMTLDFLFEHEAVSRISILSDMRSPKEGDNTRRTYEAYLPLVAVCRPDWDEETVRRKTLCLITVMQQVFLRHEMVSQTLGVPLDTKEGRHALHAQLLRDLLEG